VACERTSETIKMQKKILNKKSRKVGQCQDVPFQPTGSGKFEYFGSGTSDNNRSITRHVRSTNFKKT